MINDKEEVLIDIIGRLMKDKGNQVEENGEPKLERRNRCRGRTPKERNVRKTLKMSKRDEEKRRKKGLCLGNVNFYKFNSSKEAHARSSSNRDTSY